MPRGRSVIKLLLDSSQAALFAGIEIHNKPHIKYRYPTVAILIINAWELVLKAYVYKYVGKQKIYEKDGGLTIGIKRALDMTRENIYANEKNKNFRAVCDNIKLLYEYRCANIHYVEKELDPIIFMLIYKAVLNYSSFLKKYFNKDISSEENLIILPIGFKLPLNPIEFLKDKDYVGAQNSFVNQVVQSIKDLNCEGIEDSVVVGLDLAINRVRDIRNADLVAALSHDADAVPVRKVYQITDDPKAPKVQMEIPLPPLRYYEVRAKAKEKDPNIKFGKLFNKVMSEIKADPSLCLARYLDPIQKTGTKKDFYEERAVDVLVQRYEELMAVENHKT